MQLEVRQGNWTEDANVQLQTFQFPGEAQPQLSRKQATREAHPPTYVRKSKFVGYMQLVGMKDLASSRNEALPYSNTCNFKQQLDNTSHVKKPVHIQTKTKARPRTTAEQADAGGGALQKLTAPAIADAAMADHEKKPGQI